MLIVHSQPIFCRFNFVYCLLIYSQNCDYFLPSKLRSPVFVLRENFHISCRGSYKVQEESFYPLVVVGGGGSGTPGSPRYFFFFEKRMQMVHSEPFLGRLLVNIFSKIVADFCHDFEFTLYRGMWGNSGRFSYPPIIGHVIHVIRNLSAFYSISCLN